jgi:hypothetical protein
LQTIQRQPSNERGRYPLRSIGCSLTLSCPLIKHSEHSEQHRFLDGRVIISTVPRNARNTDFMQMSPNEFKLLKSDMQ